VLRQRLRSARWVTVVIATLAMATGSVSIASPAHAEVFPVEDGFEGNARARWQIGQIAGFTTADFYVGRNFARTDTGFARLDGVYDLPALASIFRTSTPDDTTPRRLVCTPEIWAWVGISADSRNVALILRVRDGGRTGRIISNRGYTLDVAQSGGYVRAPFDPIPWQIRTYTVEISVYNGRVLLDDFRIVCQ
jgi:hypothetical protein